MKSIAIYEPDPRICGPGTWARHLKIGIERLGLHCDVVSFTKSGRARTKWGRCVRDKGSAQSSPLEPSRVEPFSVASDVLSEYDLVILPEPKSPTEDFAALRQLLEEPDYVRVLRHCKSPWTTALHGKYYYEPHESPSRMAADRGTPFLKDLLTLDNFTGFVLEHAPDRQFATNAERLVPLRHAYAPLPYALDDFHADARTSCWAPRERQTLCVLGRVTKVKYRHYVNHMAITGRLRGWDVVYAGGSSCQQGPNESFMLYEHLERAGATNCQREGGSKSASPWSAEIADCRISFYGVYDHPQDVVAGATVHVGLTDHLFSGGLMEFSTLEATAEGLIPVISRPFVPPYGEDFVMSVLELEMHGHHGGAKTAEGFGVLDTSKDPVIDEICDDLAECVYRARAQHTHQNWDLNQIAMRKHNDPAAVAKVFLEGAGITVS
jgi:hypothetical protein